MLHNWAGQAGVAAEVTAPSECCGRMSDADSVGKGGMGYDADAGKDKVESVAEERWGKPAGATGKEKSMSVWKDDVEKARFGREALLKRSAFWLVSWNR